jgi:hypothetical protein
MSFELSEIVVKFQFLERFVVRNLRVICTLSVEQQFQFCCSYNSEQNVQIKKKNWKLVL